MGLLEDLPELVIDVIYLLRTLEKDETEMNTSDLVSLFCCFGAR